MRSPLSKLLLAMAAVIWAPACSTLPDRDGLQAGAAVSVLPNIGLSVLVADTFSESPERTWSWEVQGTGQWFDDEDLLDDGATAAGPVRQLRAGVKANLAPGELRQWIARVGALWIHVQGVPNMLDLPGHHLGAYASFGMQTRLSDRLSVGPEVAVQLVRRTESPARWEPIPQFLYHFIWTF